MLPLLYQLLFSTYKEWGGIEKGVQMTKQEAIKAIKDNYPSSGYTMLCEGLDIAIECIEKQIPLKPHKAFDHTWGIEKVANVCPVCDYYLGNHAFISIGVGGNKVIYCETCGQAILWESDNDEDI